MKTVPPPKSLLLSVLLAAVVAPTDPARASEQEAAPPGRVPWPDGLGGGAFQRVVVGAFAADRVSHALILRGGAPVMMFCPPAMNVFHPLAGDGWIDVAAAPGAGHDGRDAIAFTDGAGLHLVEYEDSLEDLTDPIHVGTAWAGASMLRGAEIAGQPGLCGLSASGHEILTAVRIGGAWSSGPTLSFVPVVSGYAVGDLDRDGANEVVVLLPNKRKIVEFDGAVRRVDDLGPGNRLVATIGRDDGFVGHVGILATDDLVPGEYRIRAFDVTGAEPPQDLVLWCEGTPHWVTPTSLVAADVDGDGDDDVIVRHTSFAALSSVLSEFDGVRHLQETPGPSWNLDSNPHLAIPGEVGSSSIASAPGATDHAVVPLGFADAVHIEDPLATYASEAFEVTLAWYEYVPAPHGCTVWLLTTIPESALGGTYTHLQVVLWRQPDPTTTSGEIERDAVLNHVYPLDEEGGATWSVPVTFSLPPEDDGDPFWSSRTHYYAQIRLVAAAPAGAGSDDGDEAVITLSGPERRGGFTMREGLDDTSYDQYLVSRPTAEPRVDVLPAPGGHPGTSTPVGAFIPLGRLPGFEPLPPRPGTPVFDHGAEKLAE